MRILHVCLANYYVDNFGYQENVLTRVHKLQGHDVKILAATETLSSKSGIQYLEPSSYLNEDGIPVVRVPYVKWLPHKVGAKLRIYKGVAREIQEFSPDVIFMHDGQTFSIFEITSYLKKHENVRLYMDSHTDYVNSAHGFVSHNILHGMIYKFYIRKSIPYVTKYYGTLPARVDFYCDMYGVPRNKMEYLPMGVDDLSIDFSKRNIIRDEIRSNLGISKESFVFVSGGKLGRQKNTLQLIRAFKSLPYQNIRLVLFGSVMADIKEEWNNIINDPRIIYVGWINSKEAYRYFFASDFACFPGTHSTLWEEAVGYGLPCLFKKWNGINQIDLDGNCIVSDQCESESYIKEILDSIVIDTCKYENLKHVAMEKGINTFSYNRIARYSIGL